MCTHSDSQSKRLIIITRLQYCLVANKSSRKRKTEKRMDLEGEEERRDSEVVTSIEIQADDHSL